MGSGRAYGPPPRRCKRRASRPQAAARIVLLTDVGTRPSQS
jgi:hypothetical protein